MTICRRGRYRVELVDSVISPMGNAFLTYSLKARPARDQSLVL
ncbi:MAG: hypothetical protein ACK5PP_05110 [Acidimicrobiales bacterium]